MVTMGIAPIKSSLLLFIIINTLLESRCTVKGLTPISFSLVLQFPVGFCVAAWGITGRVGLRVGERCASHVQTIAVVVSRADNNPW